MTTRSEFLAGVSLYLRNSSLHPFCKKEIKDAKESRRTPYSRFPFRPQSPDTHFISCPSCMNLPIKATPESESTSVGKNMAASVDARTQGRDSDPRMYIYVDARHITHEISTTHSSKIMFRFIILETHTAHQGVVTAQHLQCQHQ